jgi:ABC-type arginine/histidine transport system permease subunit
MDLTGVARVIAARSFAFYEVFLTAAALYVVLVYAVLFAFKAVERRLNRHLDVADSSNMVNPAL